MRKVDKGPLSNVDEGALWWQGNEDGSPTFLDVADIFVITIFAIDIILNFLTGFACPKACPELDGRFRSA